MFINAGNITDGWKRILNVIWYSGTEIRSERGKTKEILNLMVRVQNPNDRKIDGFPMGEIELKNYAKQFLNKSRGDFEYTYGERLRNWGSEITGPVDQITQITRRLNKTKNTRRATAVTWIPPMDYTKTEVPCLILTDFKVREKKLHLTAVFRSNDMFGAWPANLYALNRLNAFVARNIKSKITPGPITTLSISAHVYDHDFPNVERILGIQ